MPKKIWCSSISIRSCLNFIKSYPDFCTFCYATIEINSHDMKFV